MNIVFFGTPQFVIPVLQKLIENFKVIAVVTTPDQPIGRKKIMTPSPIKKYAVEQKIPTLTPENVSLEDFKRNLMNYSPTGIDMFIIAAYGKIIPQAILDIPKFGSLNIHPSLLPKYRGPSPLQYAILNGDEITGVSIMKIDAQIDHGPILKTMQLTINQDDTFETLADRAFKEGANLLPQVMKSHLSDEIIPQNQEHEKATYTRLITKQNGYISLEALEKLNKQELEKQKIEISRKIRAYYPWPTAWTKININNQEKILKLLPKQKIQLEGKKPMTIKDFTNGYPEAKKIVEKIF